MRVKACYSFLLFLVLLLPVIGFAQNVSVNEDLIAAVKKGDLEAVKSLIAKGANVNVRTNYGATALHFAADRGHLEIIKALVEAGADVNAKDEFYKFTPTMMAIMRQHKEVIVYLQQAASAKKEIPQPSPTAPAAPAAASQPAAKTADSALNEELLGAAKRGDAAAVKVALDLGGFTEATLNRALGFAGENKEIAEMLKKAGAKPAERKESKPEVKIDEATLQKYAGTYRLDEARQYTFIAKDGKLVGWDVRQYSISLTAIDKNVFRFGNDDSRTIAFNEENGRIISVTLNQAGFKQTYNRVEGK
jgi:hypothetical protein